MVLSFPLSGCNSKGNSDQEAAAKSATAGIAGRYYLYTCENQLYCLDLQTGEIDQIHTGTDVTSIPHAMISEEGGPMLIQVATGKDGQATALLMWDGKSQDATLIDTNATLVRVNQAMDHVVYTKGATLYEYRNNRTEKVYDLLYKVSAAEDCSNVLMTAAPADLLDDPLSDGTIREFDLLYKKTGQKAIKISTISAAACYPSATPDHSVVCYTKGPSGTSLFDSYPVYMWTPEGGEVALPFEAIQIAVHSKNEIYYISGEDLNLSLFYYNGKESQLLCEGVYNHLHKLSDDFTYIRLYGQENGLILHGGKSLKVPGIICPQKACRGVVSDNKKCVYTHSDGNWYKTQLQSNGELTVSNYFTGPNVTLLQNDLFAYEQDGALYCNGQLVAQNVDNYQIWPSGQLHYQKEGKLYCWDNGRSTVVADIADETIVCCGYQENLLVQEGDDLYLIRGTEKTPLPPNIEAAALVVTWDTRPHDDFHSGGATTGWWYESSTYVSYVYS